MCPTEAAVEDGHGAGTLRPWVAVRLTLGVVRVLGKALGVCEHARVGAPSNPPVSTALEG